MFGTIMNNGKIDLLSLIIKTPIVHTVTYFIAGVIAMTLLDYGESMGTGHSILNRLLIHW